MDFKEVFRSIKELPKECYLCGASVEKPEEDHLPPKCLFPRQYRSRLISVPICRECHDKRDKDDEYFRDYITLWCGKNVPNQLHEKRERSWDKSPAHMIGTMRHRTRVWVELPSGLSMPTSAFKAEMNRINPVLESIVKGYYFSLRGRRIPESDCLIALTKAPFIEEITNPEARFWLNKTVPHEVVPGLFGFSGCCFNDGHINKTNWFLEFFKVVQFFVQFQWEVKGSIMA
jgi:hypothetical protein